MHNSKISGRLWLNMILFGLVGQLAWNVENMYFNTFLYNKIYAGVSQNAIDSSISVMSAISLMVALSAATAVITTFVMGTLSDRLNRRKLFISFGYILWGGVTAAFGLISRENIAAILHLSDEVKILSATVWTVIIMDCLMTFMGSTSNDSVFNAWVTDVTAPENRPKVETVFAALPIVATGIVVGLGSLAQAGVIGYDLFFLCLGGFVILCGILGLFTLQETEHRVRQSGANYWSDLFYGFRPSVIRSHKQLYLSLATLGFFAIAVQVFFPYLLIYLQYVILPTVPAFDSFDMSYYICAAVCVVVLAAGLFILLKLGNKDKKKALVPGALSFLIGLLILGFAHDIRLLLIGLAPTVVGYASLMILLNAAIRDFTPEDKAGQFQGIRMIFYVLIPMVVGPMLGKTASVSSAVPYIDEFGVSQLAPTSAMFLWAAAVAALVFVPLVFLIKAGFQVKQTNQEIQ